jgi:hypothetical protein
MIREGSAASVLLAAIVLLSLCGCVQFWESEHQEVHDLSLTVMCGRDVGIEFNVSGRIQAPVQDLLESRCHLRGDGVAIVIECPGNGRNWTEIRDMGTRAISTGRANRSFESVAVADQHIVP